ncbi:MAG: hypothetical protein LBQ44_03110 [Treponema sp.]|nr:hypothetical protein [Treponema sp.]
MNFQKPGEIIRSHLIPFCCAAGALLIVLVFLLILAVVKRPAKPGEEPRASAELSPAVISGDFFLPYEPDFVPDVLLEREPREGWSEEDVRPFWTDPMEGNEETWRRRIEEGVDGILERVP